MSRETIITHNVYIGYNYLLGKYFVGNKDALTYRVSATETKKVLDILVPNNSITVEQIVNLSTTLETLTSLSYVLSDTGAYIAGIQINDYSEYPIVLNAEKHKLYIMNTNLVFDLTLNESASNRVAIIQAYYKEHLGLLLTTEELTSIYNYILNTYNPYVYNCIFDTETTPLSYSNSFACSNWNSKGKATYECNTNPYGEYTNTDIAHITNIDSSINAITLSSTIPSSLTTGSKVIIQNATTVMETYTYSADGEYTIASLNTDTNTIYTTETISGSYTYNYPIAYVVTSKVNIASIERDSSTITLTSTVPNSIQIGDIIYVTGTQQTVEGETISCDGEYVVGSTDGNNIVVQMPPKTNYVYTSGTHAQISKRLLIGNVQSISDGTITLTQPTSQAISTGSNVVVMYNNTDTFFTVNSYTTTVMNCTYNSGTLTTYNVDYPVLQVPVPYTEILISVTTSSDQKVLPTGEFLVDNFNQCVEYLNLLEGNKIPTISIFNNLNQPVPEEITITDTLPKAKLLGVFSKVYNQ